MISAALAMLALLACSSDGASSRDVSVIDLDAARPPDTRSLFFDAGPLPDRGDGHPCDCNVGVGCTPDRGCRTGTCQPEIVYERGIGTPECPTTFGTLFLNGYCTPAPPATPDSGGCDPDDPVSCGPCTDCARCVRLGEATMCARVCRPTADDNSECALDSHQCTFEGYCIDGCQTDEDCRTFVDELGITCRDESSMATCNPFTRRCEHPSGGAAAGDPCTRDSQCEADGVCRGDWPDGYCTRYGCDVAGITCERPGKCQQRRVGDVAMCGHGCVVGAERDDPSAVVGVAGHGAGCRPGYACIWDGVRGTDTDNGICAPALYNDRASVNVGSPCDADAAFPDCYSPFGQGLCLGGTGTAWDPHGYCTITDCAAPGMPADICGPSALCLAFADAGTTSVCLETCATADTCTPGLGCVPTSLLGGTTDDRVCIPVCADDSHCRPTDRCIGAGDPAGRCEPR